MYKDPVKQPKPKGTNLVLDPYEEEDWGDLDEGVKIKRIKDL